MARSTPGKDPQQSPKSFPFPRLLLLEVACVPRKASPGPSTRAPGAHAQGAQACTRMHTQGPAAAASSSRTEEW